MFFFCVDPTEAYFNVSLALVHFLGEYRLRFESVDFQTYNFLMRSVNFRINQENNKYKVWH